MNEPRKYTNFYKAKDVAKVKALYLSGLPILEISRQTKINRNTIKKWQEKYEWHKEREAANDIAIKEAMPTILERLKKGLEMGGNNLLRLTAALQARTLEIQQKLSNPETSKQVTNLDLQFVSNAIASNNIALEKMINRYSGVATDGNSIEFSASASMKINLERLSDEELSRLRSLQTEVRGIIERAVKQPAKPITCASERSGG